MPADQIIRKPKDANDAEGIKAYRAALGVPESADKYDLPVPDGQDPKFANWARSTFLEAGVPADVAKGVAEKWNGFLAQEVAAQDEANKQAIAAADVALKTAWGNEYDANRELAKRAFTSFAEKAQLTDAVGHLEQLMGIPSVIKLFHAIGAASGEAGFKTGGADGGGAYTPETAKVKLATLRADPEWSAAYMRGDLTKQLEFQRLNAVITGDDSGVREIERKIARG